MKSVIASVLFCAGVSTLALDSPKKMIEFDMKVVKKEVNDKKPTFSGLIHSLMEDY